MPKQAIYYDRDFEAGALDYIRAHPGETTSQVLDGLGGRKGWRSRYSAAIQALKAAGRITWVTKGVFGGWEAVD